MKRNDNKIWIGIVIGLFTAVLSIFILYLVRYTNMNLGDYFVLLYRSKRLLSPIVSIAGVPNLIIFFLFLNRHKYKTARGIIMATFILALMVVFIKILLT